MPPRSTDKGRRKELRSSRSSSVSRKSKKEDLPRKAAKIRRTFPEPGVAKTELRFVVYNESGGKYQREKFMQDVAEFFQEQAKRMAEKDIEGQIQTAEDDEKKKEPEQQPICVNKFPKVEKKFCTKTEKVCTRKCPLYECDMERESHHEQSCARAQAIRTALPVIQKLLTRIDELQSRHNNKELSAIYKTAQQVKTDAEMCLKEGGPIGDTLCDRIARLNKIAKAVLNPEKTITTKTLAVFSETSVSNNAASHAESIPNLCPRRRH